MLAGIATMILRMAVVETKMMYRGENIHGEVTTTTKVVKLMVVMTMKEMVKMVDMYDNEDIDDKDGDDETG